MQTTSESKHPGATEHEPASRAMKKRRIGISRHDAAQLGAGVRRLVRVLEPFGVMRQSALRREAGAEHWHDYEFEFALRAAVSAGAIRRLPFGFYAGTNDAGRALHEPQPTMRR